MLMKYNDYIVTTKQKIQKIIESGDYQLDNIVKDYFTAGGKGVRLQLALICGDVINTKNKEDIINIAAIVEVIHTTTLIHDDIIDKALERRGRQTLNNIYGNKKALFIGDFLFARILKEVSKINNPLLHSYLTKTLKELCYGELIQSKDLYNIDSRSIDYLKKIKRKTAILIAFACVSGAIVANKSDEEIIASYNFGYYLGMSYQIMDDYLDFVSDNTKLGKDTGQDLLNGNVTLPILLKIKKDRSKFLNYKNLTLEQKQVLITEIKNDQEILGIVKEKSDKYLNKAIACLNILNPTIRSELTYILNKLSNREN